METMGTEENRVILACTNCGVDISDISEEMPEGCTRSPNKLCEDCSAGRLFYINVYLVSRVYGGAEEGGWWYDAGHPIASVGYFSREESEKAIEVWKETYRTMGNRIGRDSVIGGPGVEAYLERKYAEPFPDKRPHYE